MDKKKEQQELNLPLQLIISFDQVISFYDRYIEDTEHPYHKSAVEITEYLENYPELREGFSDLCKLDTYKDQIDLVLEGLFPEILTDNEIKVATIPFSFQSFKYSNRLKNILKNAGDEYNFTARNLEEKELYLHACVLILNVCYGYSIDLKRPFYFDIPDKKLGVTKHYRVAFNGDFCQVIPTEKAPQITEEDVRLLLDNYDNLDVWKQKFPLDSYIFKGFGIMNLFDVTFDETLSSIRENLLRSDDNLVPELRKNLSEFFNIKDLKLGFSVFGSIDKDTHFSRIKRSESLLFSDENEVACSDFFCQGIVENIFKKRKEIAISDVEHYGELSGKNGFYSRLKAQDIQSIILIPIVASKGRDLAVLEIASPRAYELNSVNQQKLQDIIPVFEAAVSRASEDYQNTLEATIQEQYTSIHPSVKWRFYDAAENYQKQLANQVEDPMIEDIVFDEVYPLYGQSDIKGSSVARNEAIKEDLTTQLELAIKVLDAALKQDKLPIYEELIFRISTYLNDTQEGLKAGDELGILQFLKRDIYPVFNHLKATDPKLALLITEYINSLDKNLKVVYDKRKEYEDSVNILNKRLANYIDKKQEEAQAMFPHYFERYKTDGVEYNMYIGQSLVKDKPFNKLYLYNLRLWQLQNTYEMEQIAHNAKKIMENKLEVASLILVHSSPLAIKFRMDEKQFDVDGAYNIRYEIIKKRIDKACIKNTTERLTVPGKIAIVYSQDKDEREYTKYIKYMQSKNYFGKVERLELEDLQGISGLRALRVEVIYEDDFSEKSAMTIDELMQGFETKQ
ncbi:GAF domain-containing protein [Kordia zhangzhouensis]|uniref:GAF domain-containing protein n=1 Tax=Kordia zhangzhouensis TaxID=1620405 RepID=UPI000629AA69|nr:GAF domain-containing protein [Kordia zhangzhouensis]